MYKNICIPIAAKEEWQAFLNQKQVQQYDCKNFPFGDYVVLQIESWQCIFYHSGATKTRSAAACQYAIDHWKPKRIIVFGTAGGVDSRLKCLDLVVGTRAEQYDCLEGMGAKKEFFYKLVSAELDYRWTDSLKLPGKVYKGLIATGDKDVDYKMACELRKHNVLAADWESGAIGHICNLNNIPCTIIKGISDVPGFDNLNDNKDFIKRTPVIMEILVNQVLLLLLTMKKI
jgi:adenosylhomocysteine nucleosidase